MDKGFVILAQNTDTVDYVKCATVLAKSIKQHMPTENVSIITDNTVDSDIFDGRLNMKGTVLKAQYMVEDNFALNFTGGWGSRKNSQYGTTAPKVDIGDSPTTNIDDYTLYQFDATYKF